MPNRSSLMQKCEIFDQLSPAIVIPVSQYLQLLLKHFLLLLDRVQRDVRVLQQLVFLLDLLLQ